MRRLLQNKPLMIAIISVILLLILAVSTSGDRTLTWVESAVGSVAKPVQSFASAVSNSIINFFKDLFNTTDTDKENEQLKVKLAQLQQQAAELDSLKLENERLRELLNYSDITENYEYVTARVIGYSQGIWFDSFTLSVGRSKGVELNMPVVNSYGLVGRVTDVGSNWCKVTAIIDARMSVSVMVERTRDNGMIRGTLNDNTISDVMQLYYLPSNADLVPGDKIVTNGMGGIFPKGITIGTVTEVVKQTDDSDSYNALVDPSVDFKHIEEVMIALNVSETEEPK